MEGLRSLSYLLSILLTLAPVWNLTLEPIRISPGLQDTLNLSASVDDSYIVLTFEEAQKLSLFKTDCMALTGRLREFDGLLKNHYALVELKDKALAEKQVEIDLLQERASLLEQALAESEERPSWSWSTIILGTALAGTLAYAMTREY